MAELSLKQRMARFVREVMLNSWEGCDLDGGEAQDLALKHGLIRPTVYDPVKHGAIGEAEPGDEIYVFSRDLKLTLRAARKAQPEVSRP